ncbi:hypothetical protein [Rubinisphaera margarita]|uniref:hypothetical protein n=1 Tax=Rubinisphaera margarita TaxID=2909586 RepID=UPI001EE87219|nr:hypothetical protein [Rubinisphaera margarita]MCG6155289.1 hypothetical protein [Rubinisphaera margarita]
MTDLEKITSEHFDSIYDTFLRDDDELTTREQWQALFRPRPEFGNDYAGYVLRAEGKLVGILGMLFSQRRINGDLVQLCNLHTWKVDPEFRGHSLRLMRPALSLTDHTVTDFTPTESVRQISRRLGFQSLDSSLRVLLPCPSVVPARHKIECRRVTSEEIAPSSEPDLQKILLDHPTPLFSQVEVSVNNRRCLVVYSRVTRWRVPYCFVHFISDPELFVEHSLAIRRAISRLEGIGTVVLNDRQFRKSRIPFSFKWTFTNGQLFRSRQLQEHQIDSLYSDVAYLQLATIKSLSSAFRERRSKRQVASTAGV